MSNLLVHVKSSENSGLAAEAYTTVRDRIIRGELAIGQVISRRKLAVELGMSFLPVTEALIRLENEGLVESRPRAGTRVKVPTRQDVEGHYVVREALEAQAAMLFAERAERGERSELVKLAKRLDGLTIQPNGDRFIQIALHEKLHKLIAEFARCPALSDAINIMYAAAAPWLSATRPLPAHSVTEHQDLVKVLVSEKPRSRSRSDARLHIREYGVGATPLWTYFSGFRREYPERVSAHGEEASFARSASLGFGFSARGDILR